MKQIAELSTGYAIRLYELLICWRTTGKTPVIELSEFRQKWGFSILNINVCMILKIRFGTIYQTN